ncbi:Soluble starch synthase 3, chloroplastic/amyloplastic [Sesamum angolense]|uniref:starch synthase n=1 Tax=Sesamum angolense TaxID=2727404 RepID=A0AAE2BV41_9LAMI|nr:Soluble starch synthase 3, chloroplastic/amyloplastic [Sesamum angolense]
MFEMKFPYGIQDPHLIVVGGLGDVVTSLSRAVQDMNHNVDIILPKYDCLNLSNVKDIQFHKSYSWGGTEIKVWSGKVEGLSVYFLEPQNGFKLCSHEDTIALSYLISVNAYVLLPYQSTRPHGKPVALVLMISIANVSSRFFRLAAFMDVVMMGKDLVSFATQLLSFFCKVDSIHAPVAWLFKEHYMHYGLTKARVVFTIHNLEFGAQLIGKAMRFADKATTVSPTYSQEVSGNPVIAPHLYKFHGILNGIDPDIWDPYNDKFIPVMTLLLGLVTDISSNRYLTLQKMLLKANKLQRKLCSSKLGLKRADLPLIYAGADFILVPSIFEPCGLTQLTAMRYGSIPVVRKTGGLYDTVFDVDHDKERAQACGLEPNGFNFDGADSAGVDYALNRAISAWYDGREWFNSLCKRVMEQDWSWNRPALDYLELYMLLGSEEKSRNSFVQV